MAKPTAGAEKPFRPDWKSLGLGAVAGMLLLTLLLAAGGRVEEWNFGIMKVVIPTAAQGAAPTAGGSELAIESLPVSVFDYDGLGDAEVQAGWGKFTAAFSGGKASYLFDYDLPTDGRAGYAGLDFRFQQTQDLSQYEFIKIVLDYPDDGAQCELFLKDVAWKAVFFLLGKTTPPGGSLTIKGTEYSYEIPLSTFKDADLKAIYEVGFSVDADITRGAHRITVKQITFGR
jgi:hypothetical protein